MPDEVTEQLSDLEVSTDNDVKILGDEPEKSEEEEIEDKKPPELEEGKVEGKVEEEEDKGPEKEEEEEEEEHGIVGRPTFKDIKAKYPNLFKDFPDLRDMVFRERDYSELFPTVEDAKEAH